MQTRVSTKGQIVLPGQLRRQLGIQPGDPLDVDVEGQRIVLTLHPRVTPAAHIVVDPVTGFPVLSAGPDVPVLTNRQVDEMLSNFP
jgi:AbrB family looped-hinge helix DNA binding protein